MLQELLIIEFITVQIDVFIAILMKLYYMVDITVNTLKKFISVAEHIDFVIFNTRLTTNEILQKDVFSATF